MATWGLTWLGHGSWRIEAAEQTILIDPWLRGNPSFPGDRRAEAIAGATHILLTHGHDDHASEAAEIARETGATLVAIVELAGFLGVEGSVGINKGGTIALGDPASGALVEATFVHAVHSSSTMRDGKPVYLGAEGGWMLRASGATLYFMGDTDVFADMAVLQDLHNPDIAIVPIGGHYTMGPRRAAYACQKFFNLRYILPSHYATFPLLEQSADDFVAAIDDGSDVIVPAVMERIEID